MGTYKKEYIGKPEGFIQTIKEADYHFLMRGEGFDGSAYKAMEKALS